MIWDVLFHTNSKSKNEVSKKIMKSLFELFCIRYTSGAKKKRKYLLYFAISLLTDKFDSNIDIIENKESIDNIIKKINLIYKEIKRNELAPVSDTNIIIEKSNREKTMEKLEALNNINTVIRN